MSEETSPDKFVQTRKEYASFALQAALTLSEEAEHSRPFASALGQLMMTQRSCQAAAKQVLVPKLLAYPSQSTHEAVALRASNCMLQLVLSLTVHLICSWHCCAWSCLSL